MADFFFFYSEMIFLPDLSDGETSTDGFLEMDKTAEEEEFEEIAMLNSAPAASGMSNFNTLETMSARSFGFIKPTPKLRENDLANRIRRHKSFFSADTSSTNAGKNQASI